MKRKSSRRLGRSPMIERAVIIQSPIAAQGDIAPFRSAFVLDFTGERKEESSAMALVGSISQQIWDMKYRLRAPADGNMPGEPLDKTIEDTWRRVASALAAPERDLARWTERFYAAMTDFKFLPAGRVIAGAGSSRSVT